MIVIDTERGRKIADEDILDKATKAYVNKKEIITALKQGSKELKTKYGVLKSSESGEWHDERDYVGKRVFVLSERTVGMVRAIDIKDYTAWVKLGNTSLWFDLKDIRLWTEERGNECGSNSSCWERYRR